MARSQRFLDVLRAVLAQITGAAYGADESQLFGFLQKTGLEGCLLGLSVLDYGAQSGILSRRKKQGLSLFFLERRKGLLCKPHQIGR